MAINDIKDWLQIIAWVATAIGLIVTVVKFRSDFKEGRDQRKIEFRWKQAEAGKSLNDEMQKDEFAWAAMQMLDSYSRKFKIPGNNKIEEINYSDIKEAFKDEDEDTNYKYVYIRDCFDFLLYYMTMMNHYTATTLILEEDVDYPIKYYIRMMKDEFRNEIDAYLERYKLDGARKFLESYEFFPK